MSRRPIPNSVRRGPQLPFALKHELGVPQDRKRQRTQVADRKQKRQEARKGHTHNGNKRRKTLHDEIPVKELDPFSEDEELEDDYENVIGEVDEDPSAHHIKNTSTKPGDRRKTSAVSVLSEDSSANSVQDPNSSHSTALTFLEEEEDYDDSDSLSRGSREYSPEIVLDANARSFRDKQVEEDEEILALERKLGGKGKKSSKVIEDDEFGSLLGGLDAAVGKGNVRSQYRDWLQEKRSKDLQQVDEPIGRGDEDGTDSEDDSTGLTGDEDEDDGFAGFDDIEEDGDSGEDEDDHEHHHVPSPPHRKQKSIVKSMRENPYIAPMPTKDDGTAAKYVPPSRRNPPTTDEQKLERLRRQTQGTLNKLSEANIVSIVDEFEKLYQSNPRQDMTTVMIDLLLTALAIDSALQNTFIILHAAFTAAMYKVLGADVGAEIVSRLVEAFDQSGGENRDQSKANVNLASFMANLFTFGVISSTLVYDHIRLLLANFDENSAELLLRIIRDCGPQLRSDDPTALKRIVQMMNEISARMTTAGQPINIRTRVMMDTITDLKNNKTRQATNAPGAAGEHITRMRKALGSLNNRQLRATEPLGISRADVLNSEKKGKWWLVGASWKGIETEEKGQPVAKETLAHWNTDNADLDADDIDYNSLSRHYKFTTPTHRAIFTAILSATDPTDALQRISKLRLTRKQEPEIPRVLLRICRAEPVYNPYYAILARLLLRDGKRYKFAFEIALWKFFEEIGERSDNGIGDEDDDATEDFDAGSIEVHELVNIAQLYANLICRKTLTLEVLKTLNVGFLKENAGLWLEMLFIDIFTQTNLKQDEVVEIISTVRPDMANVITFFMQQKVRGSDLLNDKKKKQTVKKGVQMAVAALAAVGREANNRS